MAKKKMWVTHEKARRELGFNPGPADVALARAVDWFCRTAELRPRLYQADRGWVADYVRLRFSAVKE